MQKTIRKLISKLNEKFTIRACPLRYEYNVPISIKLNNTGSLLVTSTGSLIFSINGQTKDLSKTGVGFWVDSIRLQEHYLVGENRVLHARLSLPNGTVRMQLIGKRYEQQLDPSANAKYLVGAEITGMSETDREIYQEFLKLGKNLLVSPSKTFQATSGN